MLFIYILYFVLFNSVQSNKSLRIDSLLVTQVQDSVTPRENSNAYVIVSTKSRQGFFVDTGSTDDIANQLISTFQQQVQSNTKSPQFLFLTHGHPDHAAGIALIHKMYPSMPIYVISQQVVREAVQWTNLSCTNKIYSDTQCAINFGSTLQVLRSPRSQLAINDSSISINVLSNIIKGESSYAGLLRLITPSNAYLLFTGDAITIRSHLYVSNFFDTQTLPSSDDALCAWAGSMQASVCSLQLGKRKPIILPGHGSLSNSSNYVRDIMKNIAWLRSLRNLTFNSCNTSYIWNEMVRLYPDFEDKSLNMKGTLNMHVPADANSVNCNCQNGSPTKCPVYNSPPTCMHLDISDSSTTLACDIQGRMFQT